MNKFLKFTITFIILFLIMNFSSAYAVGIDMDLNNNSTNDSNIENSLESENQLENNNIIDNNNINTDSNYLPATQKISTSGSEENFSLNTSDIINIILISVGIVLIFLAIAILIKIN